MIGIAVYREGRYEGSYDVEVLPRVAEVVLVDSGERYSVASVEHDLTEDPPHVTVRVVDVAVTEGGQGAIQAVVRPIG